METDSKPDYLWGTRRAHATPGNKTTRREDPGARRQEKRRNMREKGRKDGETNGVDRTRLLAAGCAGDREKADAKRGEAYEEEILVTMKETTAGTHQAMAAMQNNRKPRLATNDKGGNTSALETAAQPPEGARSDEPRTAATTATGRKGERKSRQGQVGAEWVEEYGEEILRSTQERATGKQKIGAKTNDRKTQTCRAKTR